MNAPRLRWTDLTAAGREAVERHAGGAVRRTWDQPGGYTTGIAARLQFHDGGEAFLKAIPRDHELAEMYRHEAHIADALPASCPAPELRWAGEAGGWNLQLFAFVHGRHPSLAPGSPDLAATTDTVAALADTLTPCPLHQPRRVVDEFARDFTGWRRLPHRLLPDWAMPHWDAFVAYETRCGELADGDTLVHTDLRADNLLITADGQVLVVDWAWGARGAAWVDPAMLLPQLILAGHTPADAEAIMSRVPAWRSAPPDAVTRFAVALTGYWVEALHRDGLGEELQAYRRRAVQAGRAWIGHRLALTPL